MNLGWRMVAAGAGWNQRPALLMGDLVLTFAGLADLAQARALAALGVGAGDRVVVNLPNGPDAAALPAACWRLSAVPVLAPRDLRPGALAEIAARTGARVVVSEPLDPRPAGDLPAGQDCPIGSIVFTSGSTGRPKGVVQRQETLLDRAVAVGRAIGFGQGDRLLSAVPWSHDYGWTQLLALYARGVTLVLPESPGLAGLPEAMERHGATVLGGVPSAYAGLTRGVSDIRARDRASVRLVMSTGAPMSARVWEDLAEVFPGARRVLNYGLTETFRSATLRPEDEALAPRVVGSALQGSALCVVDEGGQVLPPGAWGEVVHRGAGVFEGYWDDPDQTALRRRPDPVTGRGYAVFTGDRGMLDDQGRLSLGDRIDRMVKVMGLSASPLAIETLLRDQPGVTAAAVVALPHEILGAELVALLVGGDPRQAEAACRAGLPPHERPRRILPRAALPLTASGKVDYPALLRALAGTYPSKTA